MAEQLQLGFVPALDQEIADECQRKQIEARRRNEDAQLHWAVAQLPPNPDEWNIILMGIRLARHVHLSECRSCKFGPYSHCPDALGYYWDMNHKSWLPVKVCLKDYLKWCVRHELKELIKDHYSFYFRHPQRGQSV